MMINFFQPFCILLLSGEVTYKNTTVVESYLSQEPKMNHNKTPYKFSKKNSTEHTRINNNTITIIYSQSSKKKKQFAMPSLLLVHLLLLVRDIFYDICNRPRNIL